MLKSSYECVYNRIKQPDNVQGFTHAYANGYNISFKLKWHSVYIINEAIINKKICQL